MKPSSAEDAIHEEIDIRGPREKVYAALADPAQRQRWWGAEGRFQLTHMESDLRPGGSWRMCFNGMGGRPAEVRGVYRTIEPPRVLEFTWLPDWQGDAVESLVRIELEEHEGVTTVRLTHSGLVSDASRSSHRGWPQILGWLRDYLAQPVK